ncbi:hypothetical protein MBGDF03_00698 [Thermoplasmatales archaeon SCGC AB-540-F20]|nr:hypothetical protein MBGDF03_00698 [Thermoplasmatales archaeon SCGC AB-540-F20]
MVKNESSYFDDDGKLDFDLLPKDIQQFLSNLAEIIGTTIKKLINEINNDIIRYDCKLKDFENDDEKITFIQGQLITRYNKYINPKNKTTDSDSTSEPELTPERKQKLINSILKCPDLIPMMMDEIHGGVVREDDTILALIIINGTRFVIDSNPTSGNVAINAFTRSGKDYLLIQIYKKLVPVSRNIHRSKISETAFTYWHHGDGDWTWEGKQLHLEDINDRLIESDVFKCMSSGSNVATITVNQQSVDFNVPGKPNISITAHDLNFKLEGISRFPVMNLDESNMQTRAIMEYQASTKNPKVPKHIPNQELLDAYQYCLEPVEVVIPFVDVIPKLLPSTGLFREYHLRFLDYICSSAAIHQHQRERDENGRITATFEDYLIARIAFMKMYKIDQMISTTRVDDKIIEFVKKHKSDGVTKKDMETVASNHYLYVARGPENLVDLGILNCSQDYSDKLGKYRNHYYPVEGEKIESIYLPWFPKGIEIPDDVKQEIVNLCIVVKSKLVQSMQKDDCQGEESPNQSYQSMNQSKLGCKETIRTQRIHTHNNSNNNLTLILQYLCDRIKLYNKENEQYFESKEVKTTKIVDGNKVGFTDLQKSKYVVLNRYIQMDSSEVANSKHTLDHTLDTLNESQKLQENSNKSKNKESNSSCKEDSIVEEIDWENI